MLGEVSTNDEPDRLPAAAPEHRPSAAVTHAAPTGASGGALEDSHSDDASELEALADEARSHRDAAAELTDSSAAHAVQAATSIAQRRRPAPAEGERAAVVGYLAQYEFAAARTLQALREGNLVSVRVADIKAGQIDDFQLQSTELVDAHQVKWSLHPGSTGYAEFVRDAEGRTRYMRQLADGWERLTTLHRPRRVVVHFITNDLPSAGPSTSIPRPADTPEPDGAVGTWSFAAFLTEAWQPAVDAARAGADPYGVVPARWTPAMAALAHASGLDADAWRHFLADCELQFGVPSLKTRIASALVTDAERTVLREDSNRLAHAFMQLVARPDRRAEFTREQLLDELGWRYRTEFRNQHEFPDPEIPYRNIAETASEVTAAIERFTGGYLAVVGSPGSGKSTLLTRTLRESPHRVVRYYAYVPDAVSGSLRRGEAVNFFHDLSLALDLAGFRHGTTLRDDNLDLLTPRLYAQLAQAHAEWAAGGRRTIILVDGLDHIPREQAPTQSLLNHLPHPENVPDGVLFVLGTQTDRLNGVSARIREQLDELGRRITMRPLERQDVLDIVERADLAPAPTQAERERIFGLSAGHPLALNYIINRLRHVPSATVADTLDAVEPFGEGIDRQYATIWGTTEDDVDLARLLALLARARGPVRPDWLQRWAPRQALHTVTTRLAYLFRQEHGGRWTFFHNSFRAFLLERTRGVPALGGDVDLFTELADRCAAADAREPERADELYYRARTGDTVRVLALADPEIFRTQFVTGRSAAIIRDDLAFALDAAVMRRDIVALTRVLLCSGEFGQREYYAKRLPLAEAWLDLGDVDLALGVLREGASLRTSRETALRAAAALDARGFSFEGREVFTLAEPLDVLRGTSESKGRPRDEMDLLDAWITVAPRFRSVLVLLEIIDHVQATVDEVWPRDEQDQTALDKTKARQNRLLQGLAIALDELERWEDADVVRATLRGRDGAVGWWFWSQARGCRGALAAGDRPQAEARFGVLRTAFEQGEILEYVLEPAARVAMAGGYLRLACDADAARRVLEGVGQPAPATDTYGHGGRNPFRERFSLNRVLGALGDQRPLHEIVPDVPSESAAQQSRWDEGTALVRTFERGVVHLGRLAGRTLVGEQLTPSEFEVSVRPLVRLFPDHPHLVRGAYTVLSARDEFYATLVQVALAHGAECVAVLQRLFDAEWSDEARRDAWPDSVVRGILTEALSAGAPADWVRIWLARIEPMTFRGEELETSLSDGVAQARAWVAAGDVVAARMTFERVLRATFGNESRDDQLTTCLEWAVRANHEDPARTPERLGQMAAAIVSIDGSESQGYVAPHFLEAGVAAGARPARAVIEWALRTDVRRWVEALTILIDGFATRSPAAAGLLSACYRSLVLPFAQAADFDCVAHLGAALRTAEDAEEFDALAEAIEVVALGSTRPALREAVAGHWDEGAELVRDGTVSEPTVPGQVVHAFEGLSLTLRELQARVQSVADIEDLARRLKPDAYSYRWELILAPFLARVAADELVAAAAAIPQNDYAWRVLATIAERLLDLGDSRAGAVVERVLRSSRAAGWWTHYDGGSRLTAYELLNRVSAEDGRGAAWQALRNDLSAGEVGPINVFREWHRIVPVLAPSTSAVDIWEVVSRYVAALVACAAQGEPLVIPAVEDPSDPSAAAEAVCGLVAIYLDHHALALAQGAQQFFMDRLLAGDAIAEAILAARLADVDTPKDGALLILRAVARVRGTVPALMHEALRALRQAPSFPDRRIALALSVLHDGGGHADGAGIAGIAPPPGIVRPLPPVFSLVHPPAPAPRHRPLPERGAMLEPAEDAAELVSVFRTELDLIAQWAGVQPEALYQYVADRAIASLPAGSQDYVFNDEPALRNEMSRLGLEITYRRPRPRRVERAMAEATAMLVDHGRLGKRYLPALDRLFRNADPHFLISRPTRRPSIVAPIRERAESRYVENDWTAGASADDAVAGCMMPTVWNLPVDGQRGATTESRLPDAFNDSAVAVESAGTADDGWIVLAEETWLRWLDWKQATETRVAARLEPKVWASIDPEEETADPDDIDGDASAGQALAVHVAEFSHLTADEYLMRARVSYSIVVRNITYRFETPGKGWLALNPSLAEHLGWRPAPDGLFRWLDADGKVVAESVWWQDGFAQQRPPLFDDEVGYGWLVRVSASGWQKLSAAVGPCVDWRRVARLAQEQPPNGVMEWIPVSIASRP
jgi:hypothetical protein